MTHRDPIARNMAEHAHATGQPLPGADTPLRAAAYNPASELSRLEAQRTAAQHKSRRRRVKRTHTQILWLVAAVVLIFAAAALAAEAARLSGWWPG